MAPESWSGEGFAAMDLKDLNEKGQTWGGGGDEGGGGGGDKSHFWELAFLEAVKLG